MDVVQTPGGYVTLIITIYQASTHAPNELSFEVICSVFQLNGFTHTHTQGPMGRDRGWEKANKTNCGDGC